tara:strand:- start:48157 stop:49983 length:1827 start_codon:yes stop_codon:yes gene_type:complete
MVALQILQDLNIAAALIDESDRVAAVNDAFVTATGLEQSEVENHALPHVLDAAVVAHDYTPRGVYRFRCGTGYRFFRINRNLVATKGVVTLRDVTEECSALEDLRYHYELRDRLLRDGTIGTWRYDPDAELYYFSDELSLGHAEIAEPVSVPTLQLLQHPDDVARDTEIRNRITTEGGSDSAEIRYMEADGKWTHLLVHYRAGRRTVSGRYELLGISQNVTDVAVARDLGQLNLRRLEFALQAAGAAVFEYNYVTNTFWTSKALSNFIDEDVLKTTLKNPFSLFEPEDWPRVRQMIDNTRKGDGASSVEVRTAADFGAHWVRFYYDVKRTGPNGEPVSGVGLLLDIDVQKRQAIALSEAQRAAEFANRTKTEFLSNMSHELRTPLNAILGFSEMISLCTFGPIGTKYLEYAKDIHTSGKLLLDLVNDVLDLSKLEAGKLELHASDINIGSLIDNCVTLLEGRAAEGMVELRLDLRPDLPLLRADERSVKQVVLNLLSNAVKFSPVDGIVSVGAGVDAQGSIFLTVTDQGVGMTPEEIEIAFAPFGQVDSNVARKHEGTGLGLPICRSLMELHDGELTVESAPGKGTKLAARFPADRTLHRTKNHQSGK